MEGTELVPSGFGCVHEVFLASRGVTGPKYVIEGPSGLAQALGQAVNIDWENMQNWIASTGFH